MQSKIQEKSGHLKTSRSAEKMTTDAFVGAALVHLASLAFNYLMTAFTTRSAP